MKRPATLGGVVVVVLASAVMIARTWRGWPDPLIDFGRELYVAWQVAEGAALYRDVAYFNGPLSPHVNALLFLVTGPSLLGLALLNLVIYLGIALLSYDLLRRAGDAFSAAAAGVTLATLFGFARLVGVGNYNYATPYSHEMTHGLLLGLASAWCLVRFAPAGRIAWAVACGLLAGLTFLSKVELFVATAAALTIGLIAVRERRARAIGVIVGAAVLPVLLAFALLCLRLGPAAAMKGTLGGWAYVFNPAVAALPFYRSLAGLDRPVEQAWEMAVMAAAWVLASAAAYGLAVLGVGRGRVVAIALAALLPAAGAWFFFGRIPWQTLFYPLPAAALLLTGLTALAVIRQGADERLMARLVWTAFGIVLLAKIALRPVIGHYGFVLAMPATLAVVAAATGWIPRWTGDRLGRGAAGVFRTAGVSVVATVIAVHLWAYERFYADRPVTIGTGGDRFTAAADGRAEAAAGMLSELERVAPPGATLAVVPEGAMLNYLSRRENPTPYVTLLPPEFAMFGTDAIVAAYRRLPPDFVVIAPRDLSEYGSAGFESDYGRELAEWIRAEYAPVEAPAVAPPAGAYRMTLLARRPAAAARSTGGPKGP